MARDGFTYFQIEEEGPVQPFHDVRFPLDVGLGASVAPAFATDVATSASGYEQRNVRWADARMAFDAGLGIRSEEDVSAVLAFFRARRGQAVAFRFRDPIDHASADDVVGPFDQAIGIGDGATTRFALIKRYGDGDAAQIRRITRPEPPSARVAIGGVELSEGWSLAPMGLIDFDIPPPVGAAITAGFRFDVPVRFAEDRLELSLTTFRAGEIASIPLIEVRED